MLHQLTQRTLWRGGASLFLTPEEDAENKAGIKVELTEWHAHWHVGLKVQEQERPCESVEVVRVPRGWEWTAERCGRILTLHQVDMAWYAPQMLSSTSERAIALLPTSIRRWEWLRAFAVVEWKGRHKVIRTLVLIMWVEHKEHDVEQC